MPDRMKRDAIQEEAAAWFARMQGPDAVRIRADLETWRRADSAHDLAYRSVEQTWRDSALLGLTATGKRRSLESIRTPFHGIPQRQKFAINSVLVGLALCLIFIVARPLVLPAERQIANPIGAPRIQRLADGSFVTLDTQSEITADLSGPERRIRVLRGRVRFDVAHDPAHPFVVDTPAGEVIARGTLFDVDLTHPALQVTLYRGEIDVRLDARGHGPVTARRLVPGQRIVEGSGGSNPVVTSALSDNDNNWAGGMLSFSNVPLVDVAAQANRYSINRIEVDPAVADLRVTGSFRAGNSDELARALASVLKLAAQRRHDGAWMIGPA